MTLIAELRCYLLNWKWQRGYNSILYKHAKKRVLQLVWPLASGWRQQRRSSIDESRSSVWLLHYSLVTRDLTNQLGSLLEIQSIYIYLQTSFLKVHGKMVVELTNFMAQMLRLRLLKSAAAHQFGAWFDEALSGIWSSLLCSSVAVKSHLESVKK